MKENKRKEKEKKVWLVKIAEWRWLKLEQTHKF